MSKFGWAAKSKCLRLTKNKVFCLISERGGVCPAFLNASRKMSISRETSSPGTSGPLSWGGLRALSLLVGLDSSGDLLMSRQGNC